MRPARALRQETTALATAGRPTAGTGSLGACATEFDLQGVVPVRRSQGYRPFLRDFSDVTDAPSIELASEPVVPVDVDRELGCGRRQRYDFEGGISEPRGPLGV